MRPRVAAARIGLAAAFLAGLGGAAAAHGFGIRYDLPVPLSLYLAGAGSAVALSFVVIALFAGAAPRPVAAARPRARRPSLPARCPAGEAIAVALFVAVMLAGWFGDQDPLMNLAPTAVWITWWVGLSYLSAVFGNLWGLANPWAAMFAWTERLCGGRLSLDLRYPAWLDVWPGVLLLFAFVWIELIYPRSAVPAAIAALGLCYSLVTWTGMALFGRTTWLERGEAFALAFGVYARLSPFSSDRGRPASSAMTALILFLLGSVMFDGLLATPVWAAIAARLPVGAIAGETIGLLAVWLLFIASYAAVSWVIAAAAGSGHSAGEIAGTFARTLVPIALAYHLAHYLTYLIIQGQYVIPLASDPLGRGWDLFGTAGYRVDIAIVGPRFAWLTAVGAIVAGHIAAVWLAHRKALRLFAAPRTGMPGQFAITALMVAYTVTSLTILAAPIVERRREAAEPLPPEAAVPADAVIPAAGTGLLHQVGPGHTARVALRFRVLASPFHDGTHTDAADILYAYSFAWRWGSGADADPAVAAATTLARSRLVGLRVAGSDNRSRTIRLADVTLTRELLIVETYADVDAADPDSTAAVAPPWSTVPWPVLALMGQAVSRGWAAFSEGEGRRRAVPWLDLVRDAALKERLAPLVAGFARTGWRPPALEQLVSVDAARGRWSALAAFYRAHGHFLVTNGPYRLKAWSAAGATLEAWRDLSYPLGVGSFDTLPIPRRAFITKAERTPAGLRISADVEALRKFSRSWELVREPLPQFAAEPNLSGPVALACRWLVLTDAGEVALAGTTPPAADWSFVLPLSGRLRPGNYTVAAAVLVNGNAVDLAIARIPHVVD
jgi:hypothetical protein